MNQIFSACGTVPPGSSVAGAYEEPDNSIAAQDPGKTNRYLSPLRTGITGLVAEHHAAECARKAGNENRNSNK